MASSYWSGPEDVDFGREMEPANKAITLNLSDSKSTQEFHENQSKLPFESEGSNRNRRKRPYNSVSSSKFKTRRHRGLKVCDFCRKRKLKCDKQRPMCSNCVSRGFDSCLYDTNVDDTVGGLTAEINLAETEDKEFYSVSSNYPDPSVQKSSTALLEQLRKLEKGWQITSHIVSSSKTKETLSLGPNALSISLYEELQNADISIYSREVILGDGFTYVLFDKPENENSKANILSHFFVLQCRSYERRVILGPTAVKTFVAKGQQGLMSQFRDTWTKVELTKKNWKSVTLSSGSGEPLTRDLPFFQNGDDLPKITPKFDYEICSVLPTYEQCLSLIDHFFSESTIHDINAILDEHKIKSDFKRMFLCGRTFSIDKKERKIEKFTISEVRDYYRVAVALMILALTHYHKNLPIAIEKFIFYLSSLSTERTLCLEKIQLLVLRYYYHLKFCSTDGEETTPVLLIDDAINCSIHLGLNLNIRLLFDGQESRVGNTKTIIALWLWIVYSDCDISIQVGRPLRLSNDDIKDPELFDDSTVDFYGVLKRYIIMTRTMINGIHCKDRSPPLDDYCDTLSQFINEEFPTLNYYTDSKMNHKIDLCRVRILSQCVSLLISFCSMRYLVYKELTISLENCVMKATLIAFAIYVNTLRYGCEMDRKHFAEVFVSNEASILPYTCQSIAVLRGFPVRAFVVFLALSQNSLTLYQSGLMSVMKPIQTMECDLNTIYTPQDIYISFLKYFQLYLNIFDELNGLELPDSIPGMNNILEYVLGKTYEKIGRDIIKQVIECESNTELMRIGEVCMQKTAFSGLHSEHQPYSSEVDLNPTQVNEASSTAIPNESTIQALEENTYSLDQQIISQAEERVQTNGDSVNECSENTKSSEQICTEIGCDKPIVSNGRDGPEFLDCRRPGIDSLDFGHSSSEGINYNY